MMTEIIGATAGDNISKDVFPNLMTCKIMYCDKIKLEDIEFWRGDSACQLKSLDLRCDEEIQLPSTWQLQIYNQLENLTLGSCWWHEQISPCFSRLQQLKVTKSGRSTLFPFSVISNLQQLEEIEISDCAFLKDIVEEDVRGNGASSTDKKIIELIQLRSVVLKNLPTLGGFMSGADYECHMPALSSVEIGNCVFTTLFTCCRDLQQLRYLNVRNCRLLEYIVKDTKNDEISEANDKIITLSQLWSIKLENLPNLKSLGHTSSYAFDMPELHRFKMLRCPQVESFSYPKTRRSVLVTSDWHMEGEYVWDLNDYIKQNCKRGSNIISDSAGESIRKGLSRAAS